MRTADMIKSKYWRARDLEGQQPVTLTIADVSEELMGRGTRQDVKCFLWFREHAKGLQLNKTRVNILEAAFGPDSELWVGKRVRLSFDPTVEFGGRAVGGVGLQTPPGVVYQPGGGLPGWGDAPQNGPGRPPAPVWDEKRQQWITPQPVKIAAPASSQRPPPPVWNESTGQWETVHPGTGEIAAQQPVDHDRAWRFDHNAHLRPATISERVNAAHPPQSDFSPVGSPDNEFGDDIPEFGDDIPF